MSDLCFVFASAAEKNADKIINKYLKDTDFDIYHKNNGRIVVHFWDEKYLQNFPHKDGRNQQASEQKG